MIFLIEYDRPTGTMVEMRAFPDSRRSDAESSRLQLELELNRGGLGHEVVALEAENEEALHQTHQRYFASPSEIGERIAGAVG